MNRKKRNRRIAAAAMASMFSLSAFGAAYAGEWKQEGGRWWYQNEDGSYPSKGWQEIGGKHYYFDQDGYMLADTTTPDGYPVGKDGAWITEDAKAAEAAADKALHDNDANRAALEAYRAELLNGSYQLAISQFAVLDLDQDGIYEVHFWGSHEQRFTQYFMYYDNGVKKEEYLPKFAFNGVGNGRYMISGLETGVMTGMVFELKDRVVSPVDSFGYLTAAYQAGNVDEQKEQQYQAQMVSYNVVDASEENINRYLGGNGESTGLFEEQ